MGTLGNVPLASAHGRCTVAALSCIQWKAHHRFHVPHDIEYLQLQLQKNRFSTTLEIHQLVGCLFIWLVGRFVW